MIREILSEVKEAYKKREIKAYFQPQYDAVTRKNMMMYWLLA